MLSDCVQNQDLHPLGYSENLQNVKFLYTSCGTDQMKPGAPVRKKTDLQVSNDSTKQVPCGVSKI